MKKEERRKKEEIMMTNKGREKKARLFLLFSLFIFIFSFAACKFGFDERPDERGAGIVPVSDITGVPASGQPFIITSLSAAVLPENATNKKIVWSIKSDGGTNSTLDGNRLTAGAEGTVTVTATIANGLGAGVDFAKDFAIQITLLAQFPVTNIAGIPEVLPVGARSLVLNGVVEPSNAAYKDIVWRVTDAGTTGAEIDDGNILAATAAGTVKIRATIANGRLNGDYTQDFSILITRGVIASGMYDFRGDGRSEAAFWVDGVLNKLNNTGIVYYSGSGVLYGSATDDSGVGDGYIASTTTGIVIANGKHYIAGYYCAGQSSNNRYFNVCYWVDGVEKPLPGGEGSAVSGTPDSPVTNTRTYSIVTDGAYVYILGKVRNNSCYWKIDTATGAAEKINLYNPNGTTPNTGFPTSERHTNNMTVTDEGRVVIGDYPGTCYWDSKDIVNGSITGVEITALSTYSLKNITAAGRVNGEAYLAGTVDGTPFYYRVNGGLSVMPSSKNPPHASWNQGVFSIIDQNGGPVFYAMTNVGTMTNYGDLWCWDTEWNMTRLPKTYITPRLNRLVYADGYLYLPFRQRGYMVQREREPFPTRAVENPRISTEARVFGIAVMSGDMPSISFGSVPAPVWVEGGAVSLSVPKITAVGQTVTEQGWQISDDGNTDWAAFTPPPTADMSLNNKYLRYYAKGSTGGEFYSNVVRITVNPAVGSITAPVWIEATAISPLTPPALNLSGLTRRGWQTSATNTSASVWTDYTPPATAVLSDNGKYLRYYATGGGGQPYYSNVVQITVSAVQIGSISPPTLREGSSTITLTAPSVTPSGLFYNQRWETNVNNSDTGWTTLFTNQPVTMALNGRYLRFVIITSPLAPNEREFYSNVVQITVSSGSSMEMVRIPAGTFTMGSPNGTNPATNQPFPSAEQPQHQVTLTQSFYMGKFEVTQGQYYTVMGGSAPNASQSNLPRVSVNWFAVLVFCNRLSMQENLSPAYLINNSTDPADWGDIPTGYGGNFNSYNAVTIVPNSNGYRLPTEAQWEYAAKGGNNSPGGYIYAGSDTVDDVAWYNDNASNTTHEVGTKAPNGLGLYDMSGNVNEWCWDRYGSDYYASNPATDPMGPSSGDSRVHRGGSFLSQANYQRSANRSYLTVYTSSTQGGFRVVRPAED